MDSGLTGDELEEIRKRAQKLVSGMQPYHEGDTSSGCASASAGELFQYEYQKDLREFLDRKQRGRSKHGKP